MSTKATACPQCGYQKPKSMGFFKKLILGFFVLCVGLAVFNSVKRDLGGAQGGAVAKASAPKPQLTPEQQAAKDKADKRVQNAVLGATMIQKGMKDPKSFDLETAIVIEETGDMCYQFRAKNSFGAVVPGAGVISEDFKLAKVDGDNGFAAAWNKRCQGRSGDSVAALWRMMN
jgi:hypothetical protein